MDDPAPPVPDPVLPGSAPVDSTPVDSAPVDSTPVDSARADSATVERQPARVLPPFVPPAPVVRSGLRWRTGIALVLIAFLVGLGLAAFLMTRFAKTPDIKSVATVTVPVGANGQSPVVIVPSKTAAAAPTIDLAALSHREAELDGKLAALEARSGTIEQDSAQAAGYATRGEGLMVAFAARRAIDRGLSLGFLEGQLRARFGTAQPAAVATIVQAARDPVTLEDLRAGLDGVTPELMTGAASNGWWQSLRDEFSHLVVLRKSGTPSPLPVDRVARARRLLEAGQVEAALAEASRTPGAARAERWTGAARRYIEARRALDTIETAALLAPEVRAPTLAPPAPAIATPAPAVAPEAATATP